MKLMNLYDDELQCINAIGAKNDIKDLSRKSLWRNTCTLGQSKFRTILLSVTKKQSNVFLLSCSTTYVVNPTNNHSNFQFKVNTGTFLTLQFSLDVPNEGFFRRNLINQKEELRPFIQFVQKDFLHKWTVKVEKCSFVLNFCNSSDSLAKQGI